MESKPRWRKAEVGGVIDLIAGKRWYGQVTPLADGTFQYKGWRTNGSARTEEEAKQAIEAIAAKHPVNERIVAFPGNSRPVEHLTRLRGGAVYELEAYRNASSTVTTHGHGRYWTVKVDGRAVLTERGRPRRFASHAMARTAGLKIAFGGPGRLAELR